MKRALTLLLRHNEVQKKNIRPYYNKEVENDHMRPLFLIQDFFNHILNIKVNNTFLNLKPLCVSLTYPYLQSSGYWF